MLGRSALGLEAGRGLRGLPDQNGILVCVPRALGAIGVWGRVGGRARSGGGRGFHPDACARVASRMSHRSGRGCELWALGSEGRLGGAGQPLTAPPHLEADRGLWSMGRGQGWGGGFPRRRPCGWGDRKSWCGTQSRRRTRRCSEMVMVPGGFT